MSFADLPGSEFIDGYFVVPETPEWYELWNDRERRKAKEFTDKHGGAYAVKINGDSDEPVVWFVKDGRELKNFECDALIPPDEEKAKEIEVLVREYRDMPWDRDKVMEMVERIHEAIEEAGGVLLYWQ